MNSLLSITTLLFLSSTIILTVLLMSKRQTARMHAGSQQPDKKSPADSSGIIPESEQRFSALFENMQDAVFFINDDATLHEVNHAALDMFGYTRSELQGKPIKELCVDPVDFERLQQQLGQRQAIAEFEMRLRRKDGSELDGQISAFQWRSTDGSPLGYQGVLRDITALRRAERQNAERRRTMHLVIQSMPNVLLVIDAEDCLASFFFPPRFPPVISTEFLAIQQPLADVLPEDLREKTQEGLKNARDREEVTTFEHRLEDGNDVHFLKFKVSPVTDSRDALIVIDDISDLKHAEQTILQYTVELEERNQELDAFTHTAAHDLKSPLAQITTYTTLLQRKGENYIPEEDAEYLTSVHQTALKMGEIIDALLLFARLRDRDEVLEEVRMRPVVDASVAQFRAEVELRGVEITVEPDLPAAHGYGPWLEEVFSNLISNAIKYIGQDNPEPRIVIGGSVQNGRARYEVRDNGLGIAASDQERLFEQFSRFHKGEASGLGLGLSIVQRIIKKLNGKLGVESVAGEGSTFWFELPLQ